jgi:hypothetical protein
VFDTDGNKSLSPEYVKRMREFRGSQYDAYAFMVWNFLETVHDRCQEEPTLLGTWAPVVAAENELHRGWFLQQMRIQIEHKRRDGTNYVRSDKFCEHFQAFIFDMRFKPTLKAKLTENIKHIHAIVDALKADDERRAMLDKYLAAAEYSDWSYSTEDPLWNPSLPADHKKQPNRSFLKMPECTFSGDEKPTYLFP